MNLDGSSLGNPGSAGAGGRLRDHCGQWLMGFKYKVGISDNLLAELWEIYLRAKICWEHAYRKVILESDSMLAISKIKGITNERDPYWALTKACREKLAKDWKCELRHVHREENFCAD